MSINKVILLGNLGKEPEIKAFDNGGKIASITLATTKKGFTTKSGTTVPDKTEWHNIVMFNGLADVAEKYLHKGSKVYIEGEIRYREYEKDGQKKYITEIFCDNLEMCDRAQNSGSDSVSTPQPTSYQSQQKNASQPSKTVSSTYSSDNPLPPQGLGGDDLPF